jgi:hypothetical protein
MLIGTYQLEADGVSTFGKKNWKPSADGVRPGLSVVSKRLGEGTMEEIASLVIASRIVHSSVLFPAEMGSDRKEKLERATVVLFELYTGQVPARCAARCTLVVQPGAHGALPPGSGDWPARCTTSEC